MTKKAAVADNGTAAVIPGLDGTVLYNDKFDTELGTLFVKIDLKNIMDFVQDYHAKLLQARRIPINPEALSPSDPLVKFVTEHMTWIESTDVAWTASQRYQELSEQAFGHAAILAVTATPENNWKFDPSPYQEEAEDRYIIPGDVEFPKIVYNLKHPLERRLKQVMDMMMSDFSIQREIEIAVNNTMILVQRKIAAETDRDGFRPGQSG